MQGPTTDPQRRLAARALTDHGRAHEPEGFGHAIHGSARERRIADQLGLPVETRHQAGQQAHARPRVPAVEWGAGTAEACATPVHDDGPVGAALHAGPHRFDGGEGGGHVGAVGESVDDRGSFGQGPEQHRTMGDRFLAGRANGAAARHAAVDHEDAGRAHDSCSARPG